MEHFYFAVIPAPAKRLRGQAPAGIHWLQVLRDPRSLPVAGTSFARVTAIMCFSTPSSMEGLAGNKKGY